MQLGQHVGGFLLGGIRFVIGGYAIKFVGGGHAVEFVSCGGVVSEFPVDKWKRRRAQCRERATIDLIICRILGQRGVASRERRT